MRVIDKISIPTLIITAADDPFVPPGPFTDPSVARNRNITLKLTPHGGHCGFIEESRAGLRRLLGGAGNRALPDFALSRPLTGDWGLGIRD